MGYGRGRRGRIGRVRRVARAHGADAVQRVRRVERLAGLMPVQQGGRAQRSFAERQRLLAEALDRQDTVWSGMEVRPASPPRSTARTSAAAPEEDEDMREPEPLPDSFLGLLWWKLRRMLS